MEQRLSMQKAEIKSELHAGDAAPIPLEVLKGMLREFRNVFKRADHGNRKHLVHSLIKEIVVTKDRKIDKVVWKFENSMSTMLVG